VRLLGILALAALLGAGGFLVAEIFASRRLVDPTDRCAEAAPAARQAFEAGPMARNGLRVTELGNPRRADPPEGAPAGTTLCQGDAVFSSGARDVMWYALIPAAEGGEGRFMIHAAPGEMGRRSVLSVR